MWNLFEEKFDNITLVISQGYAFFNAQPIPKDESVNIKKIIYYYIFIFVKGG